MLCEFQRDIGGKAIGKLILVHGSGDLAEICHANIRAYMVAKLGNIVLSNNNNHCEVTT